MMNFRGVNFLSAFFLFLILASCSDNKTDLNKDTSEKEDEISSYICRTCLSGHSMAADAKGNIYIAEEKSRSIKILNSNGEDFVVAENLDFPIAFAVSKKGRIFVIEKNLNRLVSIGNEKKKNIIADNLHSPRDLLVDRDGNVLVLYKKGSELIKILK